MSGDVQPRKRKDKRRSRRDEEDGQSVPLVRSSSTDQHHAADNVTIHVHKEAGTGGHWCARIIFFALLAGLLGVVGLIILEHRGTTDVDTPVTASQWAMIFEGWVDETPAQHEDEHAAESDKQPGDSHEEHGDEEDEEEEGDDDDDDDESHGEETEPEEKDVDDEAEECSREEVEDQPDPGHDKTISEEETDEGIGEDEEDEDNDESHLQNDDDDNDNDVDEESPDSAERRVDYASTEKEDDGEDHNENSDDEDKGYSQENFDDDTNDLDVLEEIEDGNDVDDTEDENLANFDADLDFSIEGVKSSNDDNDFQSFTEDDTIEEYISIPGVNEIDDNSAEPLEEIDGEDSEELINETDNEGDEDEDKVEQILEEESTSVAMKFGVGVALIVTAHFVLVRRWNNGDTNNPELLTDSDEVPNLSRRNTLVPPVRIKEVNLKNSKKEQPLNKEQKQTYEELRSTYKAVESTDQKRSGIEEIFAKKTADLELMLRGGNNKDNKSKIPVENKEHRNEENEYSEGEYEYEDEEEFDDEEMEEDYEEEVEDEEDQEEDIDEVDDTELVEKLDKKYGKLPTPPYSEEEEEEEDEEEDEDEDEEEDEEEMEEEEYEEEDELRGWKHVKPPTTDNTAAQKGEATVLTKSKLSGQQGQDDFDNSLDDLRITEEK